MLLRGTKREEVERGQVLAKPGSITPHTKFTAEVYVLSKEEGGRHTPFFSGYRPQFYFRTTDVTGSVELPAGTEMVMPGDNISITVQLIAPIAMEEGLRFAIREGGRTVGAGVVAKATDSLEAGGRFQDALQLFTRLVNIGDAKSLACHPASTTHRQLNPSELARAGVKPDMVRLSIGIEHIDDLLQDLEQALQKV